MNEGMYFVKVLLIGEVESIINVKQIESIKQNGAFATISLNSGKIVDTLNEYGELIERLSGLGKSKD